MATHTGAPTPDDHSTPVRLIPLLLGPALAILILIVPPPGGLTAPAWSLVALVTWMVIWWLGEAVPLSATALLPIPMMPLLEIASLQQATSGYAHPLIFMFLGGFSISLAMQKWGLHRRIALNLISRIGKSTNGIIGGFMIATAALSMWISNTATTIMMFAVAISVIQVVENSNERGKACENFAVALMLGIAYSASIGGLGTLIGTVPNALFASFMETTYNVKIDFLSWMMIGVPVIIVMLPITWVLLTKFVFPANDLDLGETNKMVVSELNGLGPLNRGETIVMGVFAFAALGWVFGKPLAAITGLAINDTVVAVIAPLLLFAIPVSLKEGKFALDWEATRDMPWGILLLIGGGLAIAGGFKSTGLAVAIGDSLSVLQFVNLWLLVLIISAAIIFLTELTSNTASTATFLPVVGAIAVGIGQDPLLLCVAVTVGASMAFMLPVATPPNAIVFSFKGLHVHHMVRAGLWLNIVAIFVATSIVYSLAEVVFGRLPSP